MQTWQNLGCWIFENEMKIGIVRRRRGRGGRGKWDWICTGFPDCQLEFRKDMFSVWRWWDWTFVKLTHMSITSRSGDEWVRKLRGNWLVSHIIPSTHYNATTTEGSSPESSPFLEPVSIFLNVSVMDEYCVILEGVKYVERRVGETLSAAEKGGWDFLLLSFSVSSSSLSFLLILSLGLEEEWNGGQDWMCTFPGEMIGLGVPPLPDINNNNKAKENNGNFEGRQRWIIFKS